MNETTECTWLFECPKGWTVIYRWGDGWALAKGGLRVLLDCAQKADGNYWIHVSVSRKDWVPSHQDMAEVKDAFIGPSRYAYAVYPPEPFYVNIHPRCLHLWARWDDKDGRVLPEFSGVIGSVRSI